MSRSVAEALLALGSKKLPSLLPLPPKLKKDPETFSFDLELAESNDKTYPEFSWMELIKNMKQTEITENVESGAPTLNPYASDDEKDLTTTAAKFDAKYSTPATAKKKYRFEDYYIDRAVGYDESDPFIDNSDQHDEVVPSHLETVHGGFYINTGSLDFKEVELSEDDDDSSLLFTKMPKIKKAKVKITPVLGSDVLPKENPVGRPPGVSNKRPISRNNKSGIPKKRKILLPPQIGPDGNIIPRHKKIYIPFQPEFVKPENPKPKVMQVSSSSTSSSSLSSEESSSSTDSESSSSEETEDKKEAPIVKNVLPPKMKVSSVSSVMPKQMFNIIRQPDVSVTPTTASLGPTQPKQSKGLTKDLKSNGGNTVTLMSPSGILPMLPTTPSVKVSLPKPVSMPMISPGVTISAISAQISKSSNNPKAKIKNELHSTSSTVPPSQSDMVSTLAAGYTTLPNVSYFTSNLAKINFTLKNGMNLIGTPKAMPKLNKMKQVSSTVKLVHEQPKAAVQKPVKTIIKHASNPPKTPPSSRTSASSYSIGGMAASSTKFLNFDPKVFNHISSFHASNLQKNPVVSYANSPIGMTRSKSTSGKSSVNNTNRDMQRKKIYFLRL